MNAAHLAWLLSQELKKGSMTMKILKRALSLFIVGLFVFTAFAVIQSGGTNTASIHSVSSPTSILPYTTTSNGLTYTVESNGTYLWNGHYLLDPPVPYPTVPTIAPDGLPYGAVGVVGAHGHLGPYSFVRGTPKIIGISPNTTVGGVTNITEDTYWYNETLTIVGNITVTQTLYIYDSLITFKEPSSTSYGYGFIMPGVLFIEDGSVINETGNPADPWYIHVGYQNQLQIQNATLNFSVTGSNYYAGINEAGGDTGPANQMSLLRNDTIIGGGWSKYFMFEGNAYNSTFTKVFFNGGSYNSFFNESWPTLSGMGSDYAVEYNTIENMLVQPNPIFSSSMGASYWHVFSNNLIENMNLTGVTPVAWYNYPAPGPYSGEPSGANISENNSFIDINMGCPLLGGNPLIGYSLNPMNIMVDHNTFINVAYTDLFISLGGGSMQAHYNYVRGFYNNHAYLGGATYDVVPYGASGTGNISFNIFSNWISTVAKGGFGTNSYYFQDTDPQIYGAVGWVSSACPPTNVSLYGNYYMNFTGQNWGAQLMGVPMNSHSGIVASHNTFINISNSMTFSAGSGSGARNVTLIDNAQYGLYNYSVGLGSTEGGSIGGKYINNTAYDVDTTSLPFLTDSSVDTWVGVDGVLAMRNTNGTLPGPVRPQFTRLTTDITIENSSITEWVAWGAHYKTYNTSRPVLPTDFNITLYDSYVPAYFTCFSPTLGFVGHTNWGMISSEYGGGAYNRTKHSNSYFMNLTGYLGIYSGETYTLNASNIKGEANLSIYYSGNKIANIPASSSAYYNFTAISQSEYSVSTTSAASPSVNLYFHGTPGLGYTVLIISKGGLFKSFTENASSTGLINVTYDPATMPLDPTFEVSPSVAPPPPYHPVQPNPPMNFFPVYVFYILLAASAAGVAVGIYIMIRRR